MSIVIDLPPEIERELCEAASRGGVAPAERAALDVFLVRALVAGGIETPLVAEARSILRENDVDPDRLASALHQIEKTCATPRSPSSLTKRAYSPEERAELQSMVRRWREEGFMQPPGLGTSPSTDPPSREASNRLRVSALGKFAFLAFSSDDHAREKREELDREELKDGNRDL